jgi:hypothetical protein
MYGLPLGFRRLPAFATDFDASMHWIAFALVKSP